TLLTALLVLMTTLALGADTATLRARRQRATSAFPDGILLIHANSRMDIAADGFRQDPYFYYLTGQENTVGAILGLEGTSGESLLFLPSHAAFVKLGLKAPLAPGAEGEQKSGINHVLDWTELQPFLAARASSPLTLYYTRDGLAGFDEMPANLGSS